jgi:hypothetical protein
MSDDTRVNCEAQVFAARMACRAEVMKALITTGQIDVRQPLPEATLRRVDILLGVTTFQDEAATKESGEKSP